MGCSCLRNEGLHPRRGGAAAGHLAGRMSGLCGSAGLGDGGRGCWACLQGGGPGAEPWAGQVVRTVGEMIPPWGPGDHGTGLHGVAAAVRMSWRPCRARSFAVSMRRGGAVLLGGLQACRGPRRTRGRDTMPRRRTESHFRGALWCSGQEQVTSRRGLRSRP